MVYMRLTIFTFFLLLLILPGVTQAQIVLVKNNDASFGDVEFSTTHSGTIQLGTNGSASLSGGSGLVLTGSPQAGSVSITSPSTGIVEVKCTTSGKMKNGNNSLNLGNPEIAVNTGVAFGSGNACNGTRKNDAVAVVIDLSVTTSPALLLGMDIQAVSNELADGSYSSNVSGGVPIIIRVLFQ
jgi:hypothetical protein